MENKTNSEIRTANHLFPIFLKLETLSLLIVGGGNVGLEKLKAVLQNSPATIIKLVAINISEEIKELATNNINIKLIERPFIDEDIDAVDVVIIAVNNIAVSEYIRTIAKEKGKLVNVADKPELCDFYLSSIVQKGNLKIAISTNGKSPTIAKRLKETLSDVLPDELDDVLNNMHQVRQKLNGNFAEKVHTLNLLTKDLNAAKKADRNWYKIATFSLFAFFFMFVGHLVLSYVPFKEIGLSLQNLPAKIQPSFYWMILAGFLAQLVDGALGMGYGVTCATVLLSAGISPASISASIHSAEMFASGASGYSHYKFGNVNKKMFKILVIPGVIGAIIGALLLVKLQNIDTTWLRMLLAGYTFFLGVKFLINAFKKEQKQKKFKHYGVLAGLGGFLDSFGGGGWGPLVTSTLISKGRSPKYVIGSVSLTEFFVTLASAFTFFTLLGVSHWQVIVGLVIGGLIAAPFAARLAGKLPKKISYILLGTLVIIWSLRILLKAFL